MEFVMVETETVASQGTERTDPNVVSVMASELAAPGAMPMPAMEWLPDGKGRAILAPPATDEGLLAEIVRYRSAGRGREAMASAWVLKDPDEIAGVWHAAMAREAVLNSPTGEIARKCSLWGAYRILWEMARVCGLAGGQDFLSGADPTELVRPRAPKLLAGHRSLLFCGRAFVAWERFSRNAPEVEVTCPISGEPAAGRGLPVWPTREGLAAPGAEEAWIETAMAVGHFLGLDRTVGGRLSLDLLFGRGDGSALWSLLDTWPSLSEIVGQELQWATEGGEMLPARGVRRTEEWMTRKLGWSVREARCGIACLRAEALARTMSSPDEDRALVTLRIEAIGEQMRKALDWRGALMAAKALAVVRGVAKENDGDEMADFADIARKISSSGREPAGFLTERT
jgi:hypothetical protein